MNGMREGVGKFYYANGSTYEGSWSNNKKNGYALYTNEDGTLQYAYFDKDRKIREIYVMDNILGMYVTQLQKLCYKGRGEMENEVNEDILRIESPERSHDQFEIEESFLSHKNDLKKENNVYLEILKIGDFVPDSKHNEILNLTSQVFLRYHSQLKRWYSILCRNPKQKSEDGFFMTYKDFWKVLENLRLCNGKMNKVNFNRFMIDCYDREFGLEFRKNEIEEELELAKRYDVKIRASPLKENKLDALEVGPIETESPLKSNQESPLKSNKRSPLKSQKQKPIKEITLNSNLNSPTKTNRSPSPGLTSPNKITNSSPLETKNLPLALSPSYSPQRNLQIAGGSPKFDASELGEAELTQKIVDIILEEKERRQKRLSTCHNEDQIMLFRIFINAILRNYFFIQRSCLFKIWQCNQTSSYFKQNNDRKNNPYHRRKNET